MIYTGKGMIMNEMQTEIVKVDASAPEADVITRAGETIRKGGLVAFPTETVY